MITGYPISSTASCACLRLFTALLSGMGSPMSFISWANDSLSSPFFIVSMGVPSIFTLCSSSTPIAESDDAMLRAVCPPIVGSMPSGFSFSIILATTSGMRGSTYIMSAMSGSVIIVAGLELISMVLIPSSLIDRQAWLPE